MVRKDRHSIDTGSLTFVYARSSYFGRAYNVLRRQRIGKNIGPVEILTLTQYIRWTRVFLKCCDQIKFTLRVRNYGYTCLRKLFPKRRFIREQSRCKRTRTARNFCRPKFGTTDFATGSNVSGKLAATRPAK